MGATFSTNVTSADESIDVLYHFWPGTTPAPQPLPEAPASVNCFLQIAGRQVQLTLRDHDEGRLLERLRTVLAQYPAPQPMVETATVGEGWCAKHGLQMKWNAGKEGRKGWWSHMTANGWCSGRK
jgi:hypothetical protein